MKVILVTLLFFGFSAFSFAQTSADSTGRHFKVGLQAMSFVIHTFKTGNPQRYDLRLDPGGFVVAIPGAVALGDWYFWKKKPKMHLRFEGGWYKDSGFNDAWFIHTAIRRDFFKKPGRKFYLTAGIGPAFFMRDNWNHIYPGRVQDPFYGNRETANGLYQYRFFPIGGEVDFVWELNENWDVDLSIVPGAPAAIIIKIGARMRL